MNIGFIGLGNMGGGMARNLLGYCAEEGHRLFVFDVDGGAVARVNAASGGGKAAEAAVVCGSGDEVAGEVEVLFTSLPGAEEINRLALGGGSGEAGGILRRLADGAVWFETSTNDAGAWKRLVGEAGGRVILVDAPVTGGAEGAAAGSLTMLLGVDEGDAEVLTRYGGLLGAMTGRALRMGPSGAGYAAKLCQLHLNYLAAQGIGEALMLGEKAGMDLAVLYEVLQNSCAQSYVVERYVPLVLDGSYDPSFSLGLATRDMNLICQLGEGLGVDLQLGEAVRETYEKARGEYGADAPHLSVVRLVEERCGRLLRDGSSR